MSPFKAGAVMRVMFVMVPTIRAMLKELDEKVRTGDLDRADLEAIVAVALVEAQGQVVNFFHRNFDGINPSE